MTVAALPSSPHPHPAGVRVVARDGTLVATYPVLTRSYAADEGLPATAGCEPGCVPWLAGGRASSGGFVLCLPESPVTEAVESPIVLSLSRTDLHHDDVRRAHAELVHVWWSGSSRAELEVASDHVEVRATVKMSQLTTPVSFTGAVPDELVRVEGVAALVR